MQVPRVFLSSTYDDLRHIRRSVAQFIVKLGFKPVNFEDGEITALPRTSIEAASCLEAEQSDLFVLLLGSSYGGKHKKATLSRDHRINETRLSITQQEFEAAHRKDIPTYIFVDALVLADYETYLNTRSNRAIKYAHVDSPCVFDFLTSLYALANNNAIYPFRNCDDIETVLSKQWAGLFKTLLSVAPQSQLISALRSQISDLRAINGTLKTYMETILQCVDPPHSRSVIDKEDEKLFDLSVYGRFAIDKFAADLGRVAEKSVDKVYSIVKTSTTVDDFINACFEEPQKRMAILDSIRMSHGDDMISQVNQYRRLLKLPELRISAREKTK